MQYSVKLHSFEGPLDLLLHLIQKNDLNLNDIPVKEITEQYMAYINAMQVLHLDIASEYLVMASTLLHMKSQLLLPAEEDLYEDNMLAETEEDPKEDLMQRLIEYKKFKEAADELKERELERSNLFSKPMTDLTPLLDESEGENKQQAVDVTIYDMLQAFQKMKKRKKKQRPVYSKIHREEIPIEQRMSQLLGELHNKGGKSRFSDLFYEEDNTHLVVTFLALLELMKSNSILCEQNSNFDEIMIFKKEVHPFD
ncbi:segregation/condensation protein A [Salipaludibacillus sp. CUR1]|uniref:segregation/condensation protein A n=1 Tax=Salipaludibacillus sp. CUR1 TaxID=2820003 RepID=UPI001E570A96|nr:segregation/condensation protein A [Salipaludibacillus sp. CUR1]MCE7791077.1 segregation/condensation protein A [Salipaludibacillus sp. CUR1]